VRALKKPNKKLKVLLRLRRLDPGQWLIKKNLLHQGEVHIVNRKSGKERVIRA